MNATMIQANLDRPVWNGTLSVETHPVILARMRALLANNLFTVVAVNGCYQFKPEVRVNQRLENHGVAPDGDPRHIIERVDAERPGFTICDSYGVASLYAGGD